MPDNPTPQDSGAVGYGYIYEQANSAPGHRPMRATVRASAGSGVVSWVLVEYDHSPSLRPVQEASLRNPTLWTRVWPPECEDVFDAV